MSNNIVPEQSSYTGAHPLCSHCLSDEDDEGRNASHLLIDSLLEVQSDTTSLSEAETTIICEVADFAQSQYCDEFWASGNDQLRIMG
jgi:hypothetical protein